MKKHTSVALAMLTSAALALPLAAQAQQSATGASATQPSAKKKNTKQKHAVKKPVRKTKKDVPVKAAKAIEADTPAQTLTERLTDDELKIAQQIYTGTFPCEQGEHVTVTAIAEHPGFFTVTSGKRSYFMHPVESRTGAIRMEDNLRSAVWLQLGSKSMLMDQKMGERIADACEAQAQKDYIAYMQDHPHPQLLDTPANHQVPGRAASAPADNENLPGAPAATASDDLQSQAPANDEKPLAPVSGD